MIQYSNSIEGDLLDNIQGPEKRRIIGLFPFLLALTVFMMFAISMRAAAMKYNCSPDGIIIEDNPTEPLKMEHVSFNTSTNTLTLSGCEFNGTLDFLGGSNADNETQNITHYTIELSPGTTSVINSLKLNSAVILTIKGEGELFLGLSKEQEADQETGASLEFQQAPETLAPELIIEGGTVIIDGSSYGYTVKEEGCLYIREGARQVTLKKGKTGLILDDQIYGIPRIFSDYPCQAEYTSGNKVILSPNGTRNGSSDKGVTDTSLIEKNSDQYSQLEFKPGYTATWQNDDTNQTVLETDQGFYWEGQTPEYNGATPTKAKDAQYTYTFKGWSPTPGAIKKDTTYKADYNKAVNKYTAAFNANGHGTAPASQTVEYGAVITKPADLTASDYNFGGWYKETACTNAYDFSTKVTGNITLYAKWTKKQSGTVTTEVVPKTPDTPVPTVTGMESVAEAAVTAEEKTKIASREISVDVQLSAEKISEEKAEGAQEIKNLVPAGSTVTMFLDLNLLKHVTTNATGSTASSNIGSSNSVALRVQIPYDTARQNIQMLRCHNGTAQAFTKLEAEPTEGYADGTYFVGNGFVALYASGFSTFAIADSGYAETEKQTEEQTEKQTEEQTEKQTEEQTEKETEKETEKVTADKPAISITKAVNTGKKIQIAWKKIKGAKGYDLFVTYCGNKYPTKVTFSVKANKITIKKLNKKALKPNRCVKFIIRAYKKVNGKKKYISAAYSGHIPGVKLTRFTNVKKITVKKGSVTLKVGKTSKISATVVKYKTGKKLLNHVSKLRYKSSNTSIATVTGGGKIKAVAKGKCTIYVYATSGLTKEVKVTVK